MVAQVFDLPQEIARIKRLFEDETLIPWKHGGYDSVIQFMDDEGFSTWKNRGRCVDLDEYLELLDYHNLWSTATSNIDDLLILIEIVYNFWHIVAKLTSAHCYQSPQGRNFALLKVIMDECLSHYNYKGEYFPELEQLIVIEDKPEATAVAEIVDIDIGHKVLRYNHHMLKGDLQSKKDILLALGANLEPKRKQLNKIDRELEDGIFYILNNLNLRHNNESVGDKNYRQAVVDMDDDTLENWYDELYQMMLLAYLQLDQIERSSKVKALKQLVTPK